MLNVSLYLFKNGANIQAVRIHNNCIVGRTQGSNCPAGIHFVAALHRLQNFIIICILTAQAGLVKPPAGTLLDRILRVLMPGAVLTIISLAGWSRFVRGSMLEVLQQDYVRTARA